jgi:hypothetical protein
MDAAKDALIGLFTEIALISTGVKAWKGWCPLIEVYGVLTGHKPRNIGGFSSQLR